ncbi:MAG: radical SAM protein [Clostridium sp.]|nr:radical SAM protein [Clostridium sp.]
MGKKHYIIPIFVPHEGCPHNCVFCNQNTITGSQNKVDAQFVDRTVKEYLETIKGDKPIIELSFFGGTFTAIDMNKQKELLAVAKKYKDSGKIDFIRLSTRPDYIDKEILDNLKDYSADIIELGVQSMDNEVLKEAGRGHSAEDVVNASKMIKEYGFVLGHQIMPGLPGDDYEKDIYTVKKVIELKPDICRIYPSLVIKDTPMASMYERNVYRPYSLNEAVEISKVQYGMLTASGINVIRIGLQPTEEINVGRELIAGPFHPAFRELVIGSLYNEAIEKTIPQNYKGNILIEINSREISKLYADKKCYFEELKEKNKNCKIKVKQNDEIEKGKISIKLQNKSLKFSLKDYLKDKYEKKLSLYYS